VEENGKNGGSSTISNNRNGIAKVVVVATKCKNGDFNIGSKKKMGSFHKQMV
jgi:hypothetical protein